MSRLAYLTMLALLGCASAQRSALPSATTRSHTTYDTGTRTYDIVQETTPDILKRTLPVSLDQAWAALPAAYDDLHIPVNAVDSRSHLLGSGIVTANGSFAGTRLSRFVDCGASAVGMANADRYTVRLNVRTQLTAADSGRTMVRTLLEATARDAAISTDPVRCATTGVLERRIAQALTARVK